MSDQQQPTPALRLKPRLRPADEPPAAVTPSLPSTATTEATATPPPPPIEAPAPRIQLKPRSEPPPANPLGSGIEAAAPAPPPPPEPPRFIPPVTPVVAPPLFISDPPPAASGSASPSPAAPAAPVLFSDAPTVPGAGASDAGKFKLKPKVPLPDAPPATVPPVAVPLPPPAVAPAADAPRGTTSPIPAPGKDAPRTPPPFPVVAQVKSSTGKSNPPMPVPHVSVKASVLDVPPDAAPAASPRKSGLRVAIIAGAGVVVLGAGGFFGWKYFLARTPAPVAIKMPAKNASASNPAAKAAGPANSAPTPSDTLNKLAHAPADAINKAQDAIAARRASGQARVDAAADGIDMPDKPFGPAPAAPIKSGPQTAKSTATTSVAPGLAATTQVDAAAEANPAFRSFVANAKVGGVFQGTPARIYINGRLLHAGETVDATLGISFDAIDGEHHQLIFKDKSGATVLRKY